MSSDEWFRNSEWTPEIESRFNEKLRRAKRKSQYLRIQAGDLAERYPQIALSLLARYFELGEHVDQAEAYLFQARAYLALGEKQKAIASLQLALHREREFPNFKTQAWSRYALLIATEQETVLYHDALSVLLEHPPDSTSLPIQVFLWFSAHALICDALGEHKLATQSASKALDWGELKHSGFRYHPNFGLVGTEYDDIKNKLRQIASG